MCGACQVFRQQLRHAAQVVQHADLSSTTLRHAGMTHAAQIVQHADLVQRLRVSRRGHLLQQRHALCSALLIQVLRED